IAESQAGDDGGDVLRQFDTSLGRGKGEVLVDVSCQFALGIFFGDDARYVPIEFKNQRCYRRISASRRWRIVEGLAFRTLAPATAVGGREGIGVLIGIGFQR